MKKKYVIGLDIGGTKIECVLFILKEDKALEKVVSQRIETLRDQGYQSVMQRISNLVTNVLKSKSLSPDDLLGLGSGLPGSIDPKTRKMINGNSQIFIDQDFIRDLRELTHIQNIRIANDANLFALAEACQGAGKSYAQEFDLSYRDLTVVGIILGTGCGGGLCINAQLFTGTHGGGAEVGHSVLISGGRDCYCGRKGCAEQYLSGSSVEKHFELVKPSGAPSLRASEIFQMAKSSEKSPELLKIARKSLEDYRHNLIEFLTNLTALYDPHLFVLGGGVSTIDEIYPELEDRLWKNLFVKGSKPKVYRHKIGDSAGALGAALLIQQSSE